MPKVLVRGKWEPTLLTGRRRGVGITQSTTNGLQLILDFILYDAENDERPHLMVDTSKKVHCRVANGQSCQSVGECTVPSRVRDRIRLMKVLVVLEVPHTFILGANFWKVMGIVPDLRNDEWYFSELPASLDVVDHIRSQTLLSPLQTSRLDALVQRN
ncbi:hypothetical protein JTB14_033845 [Gonioctena quinquepunctata]|nr:hypothetical protein JTB14_033845 [Gonioctena quinquepunctata]